MVAPTICPLNEGIAMLRFLWKRIVTWAIQTVLRLWALPAKRSLGQLIPLNRNPISYNFAKSAFVLSAAFSYFLGWMFLYYYLRYFRIDLLSADIPFHYFFIYSFAPIKYMLGHYNIIDWAAMFSVVIIASIVIRLIESHGVWSILPSILVPFLLFLLFIWGHELASAAANDHALTLRSYPSNTVNFVFKNSFKLLDSKDKRLRVFLELNADYRLHSILDTKERYFVFFQDKPSSNIDGKIVLGSTSAYAVSAKDVLFKEYYVEEQILGAKSE